MDSKCRSLVEAYHSSVIAKSNGCLHFGAKSESFSPVEIIHSNVESNCFSTVETKEKFKFSSTVLNCRSLVDAEHSSKCVCIADRRLAISEDS